jgi:hypothetical protein
MESKKVSIVPCLSELGGKRGKDAEGLSPRGTCILRGRSQRPVPPRRVLCGSPSQGRQPRRPAGAGAGQVRACHQPPRRQGDWPRRTPASSTARRRGDRMNIPRRDYITLLVSAVSVVLCVSAAAQEGYYGVGHDKWHQGFYSKLKRNDGRGSCCNLMDCRPT